MTPTEQMIAQLRKQNISLKVSRILVKEIFSAQAAIFKASNEPETVGEYYLKHLSKNADYKKRESRTALQHLQ